jgi:gamma-glutamyl:cysteine ligase YbdK (ATP-grasp superfamily)
MGEEIGTSSFLHRDFRAFAFRLAEETKLLRRWLDEGRFAAGGAVGGLELEAWLVDDQQAPAPVNAELLGRLRDPLVVPELARFNIEVNSTPQPLAGRVLARLAEELRAVLERVRGVARTLGADVVTVGILPSVTPGDLSLENMSSLQRYRALNEQTLRLRKERPFRLHIQGRESLEELRPDVMLESAATSLQVHLQVDPRRAVRAYNAALIASGPTVAVAANAPYLFGKDLWDETRIPLFEQAVAVTDAGAPGRAPNRVCFGERYLRESLIECFEENLVRFDVLLPQVTEDPPEAMAHLRLHNGTIWRWNRPLVGFDPRTGEPHLRIEHRVISAPTTVEDAVANLALFFGLIESLASELPAPETRLPCAEARANFYAAARSGLEASVTWLDGRRWPVRRLLTEEVLPRAARGLAALGVDGPEGTRYLDLLAERVASGQTGAAWQRAFVARHGRDMRALTAGYRERQAGGLPAHTWTV